MSDELELKEGVQYRRRDGSGPATVRPDQSGPAGSFYNWIDSEGFYLSDSGRLFDFRETPNDIVSLWPAAEANDRAALTPKEPS